MKTRAVEDAFSRAAAMLDCGLAPRVGIVAGSGLGELADSLRIHAEFSFAELGLAPSGVGGGGVAGHRLRWIVGWMGGVPVHFLAGRRHGYEGLDAAGVAAAMRLLAAVGAREVVLTNAAGGISPLLKTGNLMLIEDFLPLTFRDPMRGILWAARAERGAPRVSPRPALDPTMTARLAVAAERAGVTMKRGVYAAVAGPNYETQAEVRAFRMSGADAVGMSTFAEAAAAAELGLRVGAVSIITNSHVAPASPTTHEEALAAAREAQRGLGLTLVEFVAGRAG